MERSMFCILIDRMISINITLYSGVIFKNITYDCNLISTWTFRWNCVSFSISHIAKSTDELKRLTAQKSLSLMQG